MTAVVTYPGIRRSSPRTFVSDCAVMTWRNLLTISRIPQLLIGATLQPLMFVLLFSYVFGSALGGDGYREFLMGGIFAQTVAFNAAFTAIGLASDSKLGIVDRFRSLPMSRLATVVGRTLSDLVINVVALAVMTGAGFVVGWQINGSAGDAAIAYLVALLFGYAMSWVGAVVGLMVQTAESAQAALMVILFPVAFVSSAFIASSSLPAPLRAVANWNPVTSVARALRERFGNPVAPDPRVPEPVTWAAQHATAYSVLACLAILVVFVPLALLAFRRR